MTHPAGGRGDYQRIFPVGGDGQTAARPTAATADPGRAGRPGARRALMRSGWKRGWILLAAWAILIGALAGRGPGVSQQADRGRGRVRARRRDGHDCPGRGRCGRQVRRAAAGRRQQAGRHRHHRPRSTSPARSRTAIRSLVAGGSETVSVPHFQSLPFDPINDFEPVIRSHDRAGRILRTGRQPLEDA
ncbi:MAG: hypothetical protein MZV63_12215 [Marinilabiliales bacterium]|nr:hypothetical protein [Marinilabiliales bacterium]